MVSISETLLGALKIINGNITISDVLIESISKSIQKSESKIEIGDLEKVSQEAALQEVANSISESQARVIQELAIARRIENAYEVEIEEIFDSSGDGNIGLRSNQGASLNIGIGGSGKKVTSRIYRFKGWTDVRSDNVVEHENEIVDNHKENE